MLFSAKRGLSTGAIIGVVIVVIAIAAVGGYFAMSSSSPPHPVTTQSTPPITSPTSTPTTTAPPTTTTAPPTTTTTPPTTTTTTPPPTTTTISTPPTTTTSTPPPTTTTSSSGGNSAGTAAIEASLKNFSSAFDSRNVLALLNFYSSTATVSWTGNTQGLGGVYQNAGNIKLLYAASIGSTTAISATISNVTTKAINPTTINATENIFLNGTSSVVGNLNASINAQQEWVNQNSAWVIQKENWNYVTFNVQNPGESTVFPQWSLQLSGYPPNLANMHKVEWNYAPYLTAAVYVLIGAVVVVAVRSSRRRDQINS